MQELIQQTVEQLLNHLGLRFSKITVDAKDESMVRVDIDSPEASRLIGWHGETINSIQHLAKSIVRAQQGMERSPFIVLDVDGYKKAQEDKVCRIAEQKIDFVRRKKTRVALPPMSPYFRRIVHLFIANNPDYADITTESIGEGDYRQVVLKLKEGSMDEGEELVPAFSKEEQEVVQEAEGGFENLDV